MRTRSEGKTPFRQLAPLWSIRWVLPPQRLSGSLLRRDIPLSPPSLPVEFYVEKLNFGNMVTDMLSGDHPATNSPTGPMHQKALWNMKWIVPIAILMVGLVTVQYWLPDPLAEAHAVQLQNIESENSSVCRKFGFQPNSDQFVTCKAELLKLWNYYKSSELVL